MSDPVSTRREGGVLEVTLDRPPANAIDLATSRVMGETFAAELEAAGVDVTYAVEPGTTHGHLNHPELPYAERTLTTVLAWLAGETR